MPSIDEHYPDRLIDKHELKMLVGLSHQHVLRLEKQRKFPRRIQIGENSVRWRLGDIMDWIAERRKQTPVAHRNAEYLEQADLFGQ